MGRWLVWLLVLTALVAGFWWQTRPEPVSVTVIAVERGVVERTVANTRAGTVKACQRAKLSLPVGGQIAMLPVKEGDHVAVNAVLMGLWNKDLQAKELQAEMASHSARLEHDAVCIRASNLQREADRLNRLLRQKLVSIEQVDQARTAALAAKASCSAAEAREQESKVALTVARAELEKTLLRAPFEGIVAEVTGAVGEFATPSPPGVATPPAIDLLTDDCHYVAAPIDEVDAGELSLKLPVRISFDAYPDQHFPGQLRRIAPYVLDLEKQARTVEVEVDFTPTPDIPLFAGYSADVEIVLQNRPNTLRIPTEALLEREFVLIYRSGEPLQKQLIRTGISNWRYTEVLEGLSEGDRVVTSLGRDQVKAGVEAVADD